METIVLSDLVEDNGSYTLFGYELGWHTGEFPKEIQVEGLSGTFEFESWLDENTAVFSTGETELFVLLQI